MSEAPKNQFHSRAFLPCSVGCVVGSLCSWHQPLAFPGADPKEEARRKKRGQDSCVLSLKEPPGRRWRTGEERGRGLVYMWRNKACYLRAGKNSLSPDLCSRRCLGAWLTLARDVAYLKRAISAFPTARGVIPQGKPEVDMKQGRLRKGTAFPLPTAKLRLMVTSFKKIFKPIFNWRLIALWWWLLTRQSKKTLKKETGPLSYPLHKNQLKLDWGFEHGTNY